MIIIIISGSSISIIISIIISSIGIIIIIITSMFKLAAWNQLILILD